MILYAIMKNNNSLPSHNIRVEDNIVVNDIVYFKINNKNNSIFAKVEKINEKSIMVSELKLIYENDKIHFYIDENNTTIKRYCQDNYFNLNRCMYKCDNNEYDLI
jgi:hypothetical protein